MSEIEDLKCEFCGQNVLEGYNQFFLAKSMIMCPKCFRKRQYEFETPEVTEYVIGKGGKWMRVHYQGPRDFKKLLGWQDSVADKPFITPSQNIKKEAV